MKILVIGANGQLGKQIFNIVNTGSSELGLIPEAIKSCELLGVDVDTLDIVDLVAVKEYMNNVKPDVVVNCAAITNVDGCETTKDLAFKVNALGARNLAMACEEIGAKIIHISTDYVFSGTGTTPYTEYDIPAPVSAYGTTKYLGEQYVRDFSSKYFIVRTAWLYGYFGKNFVYTIMRAAKERGKLTVVNDQRGNPTNAEDLAYHVLKLAFTEEYGVYHCTGEGECSWFDFASEIVKLAKIDCEVLPVTSEEYKTPAKRPEYSSLDNMMLRNTIGNDMREWKDALNVFINNFEKHNN